MNSRFLRFAPLALFLLALAVRIIGLRWGLPNETRWYSYHPDELQTVAAVANLDFFGGDFNPNFFNYPSAFLYATAFAHTVANAFGLTQEITQQNAMWALPHDIIWCARLISATLGALTASVVFLIAREIFPDSSRQTEADNATSNDQAANGETPNYANSSWRKSGAKWALMAGLFCALAPAHIQHSHFATVDVAATFWVAMCLWLSCRALNGESRRDLFLAALCAGIGAATKYNAVIVWVAPLVAALYIEYSMLRKMGLSLGVFAVAVCGFLLGCPFSVLAPREFWGDGKNSGFAYELLVHPRQGSGDLFSESGNGWLYHATFNLPFALTAPLAIASFLGLLLTIEGVFKARKTGLGGGRVLVPLLAFSLLYFFALGFSQVRFMRYLLPLIPALAIFAALFVRALVEALQTSNRLAIFAIAAILPAVCAIGSANVLSPFAQTDPRDAALAHLDSQNDAPPISVGLADAQNPLWFTTPALWPQDTPPGSGRTLANVQRNARYDLKPLGIDAAKLRLEKPRYFVWSEFQWRERERLNDANAANLRRALNIEYSKREFHNTAPLALPGRDYVPHDFLYTNPRVEVWNRK